MCNWHKNIIIKFNKLLICFALVLISSNLLANQSKIDSLLAKLPSLNEIQKVDALNAIADIYHKSDGQTATKYASEALKLAKEINYKIGVADAYNNLSIADLQLSKFESSLHHSLKALEIYEQQKKPTKSAEIYNNIANAYLNLSNYKLAVVNYKNAANLYLQVSDSISLATIYNNIAVSYDNQEILDTALVYYNLAFPLYKKLNRKEYLGLWYMNVGDLFRKQNKIEEALKYQLIAEPLLIESNDLFTLMVLYSGLPYTYIKLNNNAQALIYAKKAVQLGLQLKSSRELSYAYLTLADVYAAKKDYQNQALYIKMYSELKDSVFTEETGRAVTEMQSKYENDKKIKEIELLNKDKKLQNVEIEKHKTSRNFLLGIASLGALLIGVLAFAFRNKNKANLILKNQKDKIEIQNHLLEEKNKEILDSITYAKRLQEAILPPLKLVQKHLEKSFILYKPKDIVAGDFYWFETKGDLLLFAAADCTGHGVPGAMVSVVCSNALNRTVKEFGITEPGKILDKVRELVVETFERSESDVKDGMDISLCVLDVNTNELFWSGANNPLWLVRHEIGDNRFEMNKLDFQYSNLNTPILTEYKPDKQPIGKIENSKLFTTQKISLQKNDSFYIFTDGFCDQFGGDSGKKYKTANFKKFILSIQDKEMREQQIILSQEIEKWKGNLEQVDDILVIGVKI
ncbi:MAG: tetratricopeptide repeat protein [Bacteroidota bacterium]